MESDKTKAERGNAGEVRQRKQKTNSSKDKKSTSKSAKSHREKAAKVDLETSNSAVEPEEPYVDILRRKFLKSTNKELIVPDEDRVQLSWSNISYVVQKRKKVEGRKINLPCCGPTEDKYILNNVSGFVKPGSLVGIIGPSGAGKTSLLNILARKVTGKGLSGEIKVNGVKLTQDIWTSVAGFVAQEDVLMGTMTPYEALSFVSKLKNPELPDAERDQRVLTLLKSMGLESVKDNLIGFTGANSRNSGIKRGLSGGERKRVSIAVELVNNPKLLLLDEPTSGLDSFAAKAVMERLRDLAFMGRTIVATIHQPSYDIFRTLDELCILADGRIVYFGPAHEAVGYFTQAGYSFPKRVNPADHMMKLLHVTPKGAKVEELEDDEEEAAGTIPEGLSETTPEQVEALIKTYEGSKQYKNVTKHIQKANEKPNSGPLKNNAVAAGIMLQFAMLMGRAFKNIAREPMLLKVRFMQALTIGVLGGLMYLRIKGDQSGVQDRVSALFFILTSASFGGFNGPTFIFPSERGVFFRERSANLYSTGVYYISKLLAELPVMTIIPMIQTTVAYFMIGFNDQVIPWILTCVSMLLLSNVAFAMGMLLSCAILDTGIVIKIQPLILLPFMLFSGFFLNAASVPVYFIWLEHISFLKYAYRIACNAVFPGLKFTCEAGSICRDRTGEDVLKRLAFDTHPVWLDVVALAVMVVGYNLLAFLFLALRRKH